jgi:hypothetical protein
MEVKLFRPNLITVLECVGIVETTEVHVGGEKNRIISAFIYLIL